MLDLVRGQRVTIIKSPVVEREALVFGRNSSDFLDFSLH